MNKIVIALFVLLSCGLPVKSASFIKTWDYASGQASVSQEMGRWPAQACKVSVSPQEKTPDGAQVMELEVGAEKAGNGIASRQIMFACPNNFTLGQRIRVSFMVKSSSATTLRISGSQYQAPFGGFSGQDFEEMSVNNLWQRFSWDIEVEKTLPDAKVALPRIMFGNAAAGTKILLGPITVEEVTGSSFVNLASAANMGFADPVAGDGKGGWSDQGPNNDFRTFNYRQKTFCDIPFRIINPEKNGGKAVLSFQCPQFPGGLKEVILPLTPAATGKYLYLLHTGCWTPGPPAGIGEVSVAYTDGSSTQYPIVSGVDLRDWWSPKAASNAMIAYENNNLGIYLSRFALPNRAINKITLTNSGNGLWIVIGATISDKEAGKAVNDITTIKASSEWRPIDTADLAVKPGSALDFSALANASPVGTFGRVIVNSAGKLAFEKKPDEAIRFRCAAVQPIIEFNRLDKSQLTALVGTISRQGYNLVRLGSADAWLVGQEKAPWKVVPLQVPETVDAVKFIPERLDKLDFFIAELRKKSIYVYMEGMGSYLGYSSNANLWAFGPHHDEVAQSHLFGETKWRNDWKAGVTKLLTHVNPYTGTALRDDPVLAAFLFVNEQDLLPEHIKSTPAVLLPAWRKFLEQKYRNFDALFQAWGGKYGDKVLDRNGGFAAIPPVSSNVSYGDSPAGIDTTLFFAAAEKEMTEFYQQTVREIGYKGLTTQWDFVPRLLEIPARALSPVVSMHNYHAHPTNYVNSGSRIVQTSALQLGGNNLKQFGPTRLLNRPFMITEYGLVFWNRYRHEQGLLFGAGASLQDYDTLNLHSGPARLHNDGEQMRPFNNTAIDPINRASEVVGAFAYLRRDVATARHTVAFTVDDQYIFSGKAMNAFSDELSQLWAVSRVGIRYLNDTKTQSHADLVLKSGATSGLKYQVGAAGTESSPNHTESLASAVAELRRTKLLDNSNRSEPDKGILQSDTGEIVLNIPQGVLAVTAPRLEGVTMKQDLRMVLGKVTIEKCSVPASVTVISLDKDAPIDRSKHLLLVFSTDALNTDMQFANAERTELLNIGKLPVLMQTGKLSLTIARAGAPVPVTVYALKLNGERAEKIPCRMESGKMMLDIDTAKLSSGPTPFFEIVQD